MRLVVPVRSDVEVREWRGAPDEIVLDRLRETGGLGGPISRLLATVPE